MAIVDNLDSTIRANQFKRGEARGGSSITARNFYNLDPRESDL